MNPIFLKRNGISHSYRAIATESGYSITFDSKDGQEEFAGQVHRHGEKVRSLSMTGPLDTLKAYYAVNLHLTFAPEIEADQFYFPEDFLMHPHLATDIYRAVAQYEPYSETIRHIPTNVCLIHFRPTATKEAITKDASSYPVSRGVGGWASYAQVIAVKYANLAVDSANLPYRAIAQKGLEEFFKIHNQTHSDEQNRGWLAWLISEYIKVRADKGAIAPQSPRTLKIIDCFKSRR
jgi:hypothetical protein